MIFSEPKSSEHEAEMIADIMQDLGVSRLAAYQILPILAGVISGDMMTEDERNKLDDFRLFDWPRR